MLAHSNILDRRELVPWKASSLVLFSLALKVRRIQLATFLEEVTFTLLCYLKLRSSDIITLRSFTSFLRDDMTVPVSVHSYNLRVYLSHPQSGVVCTPESTPLRLIQHKGCSHTLHIPLSTPKGVDTGLFKQIHHLASRASKRGFRGERRKCSGLEH